MQRFFIHLTSTMHFAIIFAIFISCAFGKPIHSGRPVINKERADEDGIAIEDTRSSNFVGVAGLITTTNNEMKKFRRRGRKCRKFVINKITKVPKCVEFYKRRVRKRYQLEE